MKKIETPPIERCRTHVKQLCPAIPGTRAVYVYGEADENIVVLPVHAWALIEQTWETWDSHTDTWKEDGADRWDDHDGREEIFEAVIEVEPGVLIRAGDDADAPEGAEYLCRPVAYLSPGELAPMTQRSLFDNHVEAIAERKAAWKHRRESSQAK